MIVLCIGWSLFGTKPALWGDVRERQVRALDRMPHSNKSASVIGDSTAEDYL
jgi:hypothetical protein